MVNLGSMAGTQMIPQAQSQEQDLEHSKLYYWNIVLRVVYFGDYIIFLFVKIFDYLI